MTKQEMEQAIQGATIISIKREEVPDEILEFVKFILRHGFYPSSRRSTDEYAVYVKIGEKRLINEFCDFAWSDSGKVKVNQSVEYILD